MPGIVGLITKMPRDWAEPQLLRMVEKIRHESFYVAGTYIDEAQGVYVGWTAQQNSFAEKMPVRNERGDVVLIFSGEDCPEPQTISRLKQLGHNICGCNEAAYLAHLYEEDPEFPKCLNGRFQGLAIDSARGTSLLFNDRYGMRQVYYHQAKEAFYFACEAKAVLAVRPELRSVDLQGLSEFVSCGCVMEDRTLFRGLQLLPAGAAWSFRDAQLAKQARYFHPEEWQNQEPLDSETFYSQLREAFTANLDRYFKGKQQLGMSLTGGLDTRMLMAWHKAQPGSLPCYTFGGTYRESRDVIIARKVAQACNQTHQVITLGQDFLTRFPHYAERSVYLTDGTVDMSRTPALYGNEKARDIAPVRIAGIYGSEVIRWLPGFKPVDPSPGIYRSELMNQVQTAKQTYAGLCQGHPVNFVLFLQAPQRGVNTLEESQLTIRSPYLDNDFVRTAFRAPAPTFARSDVFSKKDVSLRLIRDGNAALSRIMTDRGLAGASNGLTAKLARAYLEFTFKAEYAYDYGMPQTVARVDHLFAPFRLERIWLGRHKFYHFRVWYRDQLSGYVREMLLDQRSLSRPYIHRNAVEHIVASHLRGTHNYTLEIHKLLTLELIHRLFVD